MGLGNRLKQIATGKKTERAVSPVERATREATEMQRRQAEALARVESTRNSEGPRKAARRSTRASDAPKALPGGAAPMTQVVLTPGGRVAEHDWELLRPADMSPYYAQIDETALRGMLGERESTAGAIDGAGVLNYIAPRYAIEEKAHYELNERFYTTLVIKRYPLHRFGPSIWNALQAMERVSLSVHYWRLDTKAAEQDLQDMIDRIEVDLMGIKEGKSKRSKSEIVDLQSELEELQTQLTNITYRTETLFHISCYIRVGGDSLDDLESNVEQVYEWARQRGLQLAELPGDQRRAMIGSMPYGADPANLSKRGATSTAAALFPLITRPYADREVDGTPRGVLYGMHAGNGTPVLMTPWNTDGTTQITTVLGRMGSGKTFWSRAHIGRLAMTGARILAVDPMGENFVRWFRNNDGQVFTIAPGSGSYINPLKRELQIDEESGQAAYEPAATKISRLMLLFSLMLETQFDATVEALLSMALDAWYASFPDHEEHLMRDFLEFMDRMKTYANGDPLSVSQLRKLSELNDVLRPICLEGPQRDYFNHPTNIDLSSNRICFNLKASGEGRSQTFAIYMAVTLAINEARRDSRKTLVVIDEIHKLFDAAGEVKALDKWISDLVRTSRHWNTAITFITQFFDESEGHGKSNRAQTSLLKGTGTFVLMRATESMLNQTIELRSVFDRELLMSFLRATDEQTQADRSSKRPMIIYRDDRPIPAWSVSLKHERDEDDTYHGQDA